MKKLTVLLSTLVLSTSAFAFGFGSGNDNSKTNNANNGNSNVTREIAADVVTIKNPAVTFTKVNNNGNQIAFDLKNSGSNIHTVVAAFSPIAKQTQLFKTFNFRGNNQSRLVRSFIIRPNQGQNQNQNQNANQQQNNINLQFFGLNKEVQQGQNIPVTIVFADGSSIQFNAQVNNTADTSNADTNNG